MGKKQPSHQAKPFQSTDLNVQQLQTFQCVFEEKGYAPAARRLKLSVPTVWQQIQAVERLYGVSLFEKQGRGIIATESAEKLYVQYSEILAGLDSTFDLIADDKSATGPIRLVTGVRMFMEDLASPLCSFRKEFENQLVIRHGNNRRAEKLILDGSADLALTLEAGHSKSDERIHYEPAYMIDFLAISSQEHAYAQSSQNSLRELVKHDLVVTLPGTHGREALDHALHREHLSANIVAETDNSGFTIAGVRAGLGVGVAAGKVNGDLCEGLFVRSLQKHLGRRQIVFMWKQGRTLTKPLKRLIELVCEHHSQSDKT